MIKGYRKEHPIMKVSLSIVIFVVEEEQWPNFKSMRSHF